ncbi:MAG: hypothetical protein R2794_08470 [Chitinophagales bacterium]
MKKRLIIIFSLVALILFLHTDVSAQCAMCKAAAEEGAQNGNTQSATLNQGILYLLMMPYLAACVIGYLWYKNAKRKKETA